MLCKEATRCATYTHFQSLRFKVAINHEFLIRRYCVLSNILINYETAVVRIVNSLDYQFRSAMVHYNAARVLLTNNVTYKLPPQFAVQPLCFYQPTLSYPKYSSVCLVTSLPTGRLRHHGPFPGRGMRFFLLQITQTRSMSRLRP